MTAKNIKKDVVIIGGGMVGLSLALALHKNGLQVAIVEAKDFIVKKLTEDRVETRVSAISHTTRNLLKELDVWDKIKSQRISTYYQMLVWDDIPSENIKITAEEVAEHNLGYIVENEVIINALLEGISNTGIEIFAGQKIHKIQRNGHSEKIFLQKYITKDKQHYSDKSNNDNIYSSVAETGLIIGADGSNSFIRDYFNFDTKVKPYNHTAIVSTIRLETEHQQTAYQRFYDKGVLAFLPLLDTHKASIVWSVKNDYADFLMQLSENEFEIELSKAINNRFGNLKLLSKRFSFELIERHAKNYVQENVALIGDAAHTIHPLAGQGVNIGFKDVVSLTKVLSEAFKKGRLLGHVATLDKYQRERKLDNAKMLLLMKAFKEVFASNNHYIKKARRTGLSLVDSNNIIKSLVVKQAL